MELHVWLALIGATGSVAVLTWALATFVVARFSAEQVRLRALTVAAPTLTIERTGLSESPDPLMAALSKALAPPGQLRGIRERLAMAGLYSLQASVAYAAARVLLPLVFASTVALVFGATAWPAALLAAAVAFLLPAFWLRRKTAQRKRTIENGIPDVLDLLVICMQAGSSLEQAIVKAGEELTVSHPALSHELRMVTTEIRAGRPRSEAFRNFETRTGVDDARALVTTLVQTDRFGTSVAQALRAHASSSRTMRRQRAEERAGKVGVKLVFPLVLCSFPSVYLVCLGPVVVQIYRSFL